MGNNKPKSYVYLSEEKVKAAVRKANTTQAMLSRQLGFGSEYVTNGLVPSKKGRFPITTALAIAGLLHVDLNELTYEPAIVVEEKVELPKPAISSQAADKLVDAIHNQNDLIRKATTAINTSLDDLIKAVETLNKNLERVEINTNRCNAHLREVHEWVSTEAKKLTKHL